MPNLIDAIDRDPEGVLNGIFDDARLAEICFDFIAIN